MPKQAAAFTLTTALLASTFIASSIERSSRPHHLAESLTTIPHELGGWTQAGSFVLPTDALQQLRATEHVARVYQRGLDSLNMFVAYYDSQAAGVSPHAPANCLSPEWEIRSAEPATIVANGTVERINKFTLSNGYSRQLLFYWYQAPNRIVRNEYARKLFAAWDLLSNGDRSEALVQIAVEDLPHLEGAARQFASAMVAEVQRCLGRRPPRRASASIRLPAIGD